MMMFLVIVSMLFHCSVQTANKIVLEKSSESDKTLFQISTFNVFYAGNYDGSEPIYELKKNGDFGIGMIHQLDGVLIGLEGVFYQIKADGQAYEVSGQVKTPYAMVSFFDADESIDVEEGPLKFKTLKKSLDRLIPDKSHLYAIRIDGKFKSVKTRSIQVQTKPYRKFTEVVKKDQKIQENGGSNGTMVGFWFPRYASGINVPGYHFHFISEDRKKGGHVLDCSLMSGSIHISYISHIHIEIKTP